MVEDKTSSLTLFDAAIVPGQSDILAPPGTVTISPTAARALLSLPSPLREGEASVASIDGVAGDVVGLFWLSEADLLPLSPLKGWGSGSARRCSERSS